MSTTAANATPTRPNRRARRAQRDPELLIGRPAANLDPYDVLLEARLRLAARERFWYGTLAQLATLNREHPDTIRRRLTRLDAEGLVWRIDGRLGGAHGLVLYIPALVPGRTFGAVPDALCARSDGTVNLVLGAIAAQAAGRPSITVGRAALAAWTRLHVDTISRVTDRAVVRGWLHKHWRPRAWSTFTLVWIGRSIRRLSVWIERMTRTAVVRAFLLARRRAAACGQLGRRAGTAPRSACGQLRGPPMTKVALSEPSRPDESSGAAHR